MNVKSKPITSQEQFRKVASRVEQLKNASPDSVQAFESKLLSKLMAEYLKKSKAELAFLHQTNRQWIRRLYLNYI